MQALQKSGIGFAPHPLARQRFFSSDYYDHDGHVNRNISMSSSRL